jgi:hypothetical protein
MMTAAEVAVLLPDAALAELRRASDEKRRWDAYVALLAGRVKELSDRELGNAGLAQSKGARTAEVLVQQLTGLSKHEAAAAVRVGSRAGFLESVRPEDLGVAKVDAVRRGLGEASAAVSEDELRSAAERLAAEAPQVSVENLAAKARAARDELDAENIARRDQEQRAAEYLSITLRGDGMYDVYGRLRPESAMVLKTATDAIISPRRGGPRFVDKEKAAEQERRAAEDDRTMGQMMVDALVDLVQVAVAASAGAELTGGKGLVTLHAVRDADGDVAAGYIEGHLDAVSNEILERYLCNSETTVVGFEHGLPVDSSTDQRLFNRRQRRALAARWGGCAIPDCDRPPPWAEAHHLKPWATGHHKTETADGILLCAHHHRLLHNNGWRIIRVGNDYVLHLPDGTVTLLESKSPAYRQHQPDLKSRLARGALAPAGARARGDGPPVRHVG